MSTPDARLSHDAYLKRPYFTELDGLRAISVLLVIATHLYDPYANWGWMAGWRGVSIFFVLSGYLITTLALREEAERGRLSLSAFYVRRCLRILPLYYVALAMYCGLVYLSGLSPHLRGPLTEAMPYYLLYLQEVPFTLCKLGVMDNLVFGHTWTLGVEEKFYLLWPLLAFVGWRLVPHKRPARTALLALVLAVVPALLTPWGLWPRIIGRTIFPYSSLLVGCLLAMLLHDPGWYARLRVLGKGAWTLITLAALLALHFASPWVSGTVGDLVNVGYSLAVAALLVCMLTADGPLQRAMRWRPLVEVGRLSYAMYLMHMLALYGVYRVLPTPWVAATAGLLVFSLTTAGTIALAWLTSVTVEQPLIAVGRRWSKAILARTAPEKKASAVVPAPRPSRLAERLLPARREEPVPVQS